MRQRVIASKPPGLFDTQDGVVIHAIDDAELFFDGDDVRIVEAEQSIQRVDGLR